MNATRFGITVKKNISGNKMFVSKFPYELFFSNSFQIRFKYFSNLLQICFKIVLILLQIYLFSDVFYKATSI